MKQWADKKVLVLGLGETGLSMARWLSAQGARLRVADSRTAPPGLAEAGKHVAAGQIFCGAFSDALLEGIEMIAISPGVPLRDPFVAKAVARGIPVVGDIELFAQQINNSLSSLSPTLWIKQLAIRLSCQKPQPSRWLSHEGRGSKREGRPLILAITGANGKTTVTSMVEHLCKAAGRDAVAAGNISPAVLDAVMARGANQPEIWVLELSSFQLETTFNLNADAATVLNLSEDHLDRYSGMDEYAAAKARIFHGNGVQVLNRDDARSMGMALHGREVVTFGLTPPGLPNPPQPSLIREGAGEESAAWGIEHDAGDVWLTQGKQRLLKASELQVAGLHNVANALAALALCRALDLPLPKLLEALRSFRGLPHRVERVAEVGGVVYYDDSKGTNVGATVAALQGLGRKAVLIAGGEGKGQDFAPLKLAVAQHARAVVLLGRDAPLIASALNGCGVQVVRAKDMSDAVQQASVLARSGDAVLLSPACASFDMFRNYAHRAEMFVQAVHELGAEHEQMPPGAPASTNSGQALPKGVKIEEGAWPR